MSKIVALFRGIRFALHLAYGLLIAVAFPWFAPILRRRILQRWSAGLLHIFNVKLHLASDTPLTQPQRGLIVTNHISWLDVFVLNAVLPMRFVAKSEVRRWPAIGWLCARAQTLFLERGKARDAARINVQLTALLREGECLAVFPEGTTTDGSSVAHFHSSLLQPAIDARVSVRPIALRYQDVSGTHNTAAAYIGDISFGTSLWNVLSTPELHVRLIATPALDACTMDRRELTRAAQAHIAGALQTANRTQIQATEITEDTENDVREQLSAIPNRV